MTRVCEQGLMEVQVQGQDEAGVVGEMEVVVEDVVENDVEAGCNNVFINAHS